MLSILSESVTNLSYIVISVILLKVSKYRSKLVVNPLYPEKMFEIILTPLKDDNNAEYFNTSEDDTKVSTKKYNQLKINSSTPKLTGICWKKLGDVEKTYYIYK